MPDFKKHRTEPERARIDLNDAQDVRYWTKEFRVSEAQLRSAIDLVGSTSATRVREFLRTSGAL